MDLVFFYGNVQCGSKMCKKYVHMIILMCTGKLQTLHRCAKQEKIIVAHFKSCYSEITKQQNTLNKEDADMKAKRIEELMDSMNSFGKDGYCKSELLGEMFALQQEIVKLAFNDEQAETANLKILDVEKYLEQINEECGHVADKELQKFRESSKTLCNLIKAEISGIRGEYKAFKALEYLRSQNIIMRNVELSNGKTRTEIDALVITSKCLTIVEVKNTAKNILIDEEGNYYRTGEFLRWDCNIAGKMSVKEELLRKVLEDAGYGHIRVRSVVVFTNNRIEVQNKFTQIRTCFVNHLAYIIDGFRMDESITLDDMENIQNAVEDAACREAYPFEFDARQYQADFASLLATLELSKAKEQDEMVSENQQERIKNQKHKKGRKFSFIDVMKNILSSKRLSYAGSMKTVVPLLP